MLHSQSFSWAGSTERVSTGHAGWIPCSSGVAELDWLLLLAGISLLEHGESFSALPQIPWEDIGPMNASRLPRAQAEVTTGVRHGEQGQCTSWGSAALQGRLLLSKGCVRLQKFWLPAWLPQLEREELNLKVLGGPGEAGWRGTSPWPPAQEARACFQPPHPLFHWRGGEV